MHIYVIQLYLLRSLIAYEKTQSQFKEDLCYLCLQLIVSNGCTPILDSLGYVIADAGGKYDCVRDFNPLTPKI